MVELNRRFLLTSYPINTDDSDDSSPSEETSFDADMVVMLAALLCALVAALLLNSVIHMILKRRRESIEPTTNMQHVGLEKRMLKKIPVTVFRLRTSSISGSATECSICLGDFVDGEKVRVLPECNHEFHVKCVDKWLKEHTSCPNCRRCLVPAKVFVEEDHATVRVERNAVIIELYVLSVQLQRAVVISVCALVNDQLEEAVVNEKVLQQVVEQLNKLVNV
ncbi:hypothetical protein R6Q59_027154 [Mikania micrantha]